MYRTKNAQQYLIDMGYGEATKSTSMHSTRNAVDLQNYSTKKVKNEKFKLYYKEDGKWKEVGNPEVIDK